MRPANLLVAFGIHLRDDQIPFLIEQEEVILILNNERVGPAHFLAVGRRSLQSLPNPLASVSPEAAQLPVTANAVDKAILKERRAES